MIPLSHCLPIGWASAAATARRAPQSAARGDAGARFRRRDARARGDRDSRARAGATAMARRRQRSKWRLTTTLTATTLATAIGRARVGRAQFQRATDYEYRVCAEQPGEYATTQTDGTTATRARCVSLDAGELGFCAGIAYDACVRTNPPSTQDKRVLSAFERMTKMQSAMAPELAGEPTCLVVMAEYMCAVAFPRCDPDPLEATKYNEVPACWDYCTNSVFGCTGEMATAMDVCNRSVYAGVVVAQDRPDVKCVSGAGELVLITVAMMTVALVLL